MLTTFILTIPYDVRPQMMSAFVSALSGTLKPNLLGMPNGPAIGFQLLASDKGIAHQLLVPSKYASYVSGQLRALVPGIRVEPTTATTGEWLHAIELGGGNSPAQSFRIPDVQALSTTILASVQGLERGEAVLIQLVTMAMPAETPPASRQPRRSNPRTLTGVVRALTPQPTDDEIQDRRGKLSTANLLGVLRIAARAEFADNPKARAVQLVGHVRQALSSASGPHNRVRRRWVPVRIVRRRIAKVAGALVYPLQLSATELAFVGWPMGQPHVAGLPAARSRQLPATAAIPRSGGTVIADSDFPGAERPLVLRPEQACQHLCVTGPTGVGKTTLLAGLLAQNNAQGHGVILVESKGDLFRQAIDLVPEYRLDDTIVLDVSDRDMPLAFNLLQDGDPRAAVERICGVFEKMYHETRGIWVRELLYMGLRTLVTNPKYTFVDLAPLLHPMAVEETAWREEVIASVTDKELQNFWQRFMKQSDGIRERMAQPVMDRIWQLNARPEIRNIIGGSQSSFDMGEVVREGRILLVNLAGLPDATASLVGTLVLSSIWSAVQAEAGNDGLAQPCFLYLDEFQSMIANLPISPQEILVKARSYNLGLILAHQNLLQLPHELRAAVQANCRSTVAFQLSADDAHSFARDFGRLVTADDFMTLGAHEIICRLATESGVSQPVTAITRPPLPPTGLGKTLRNRSRNRYGRPVHLVEAEIEARRRPSTSTPKHRPKLGPIPWNEGDTDDER